MNSYYDSFMRKYGVRNVQVSRDRGYRPIDYGYSRTATYYADREELIEMELSRSGFEQMVKIDYEYEKQWEDQREEAYLRRMNPAVEEAYSKYRMLLELYK